MNNEELCERVLIPIEGDCSKELWDRLKTVQKGLLRKYLAPPRLTIQPYWFGEHYSKQTDLWGDFNIPKFSPVRLTPEEIHAMKQNTRKLPDIGLSVADRRAVAPMKFAQAFFEANK